MLKNAGVALLPLIEGLRAAGAVGLRYAAGSRRMAGAIRAAPAGLFLREFLEAPAGVGAVWPSSEHLARGMAARIDPRGDGLVVELGAGTGVVTRALLDRGGAGGSPAGGGMFSGVRAASAPAVSGGDDPAGRRGPAVGRAG